MRLLKTHLRADLSCNFEMKIEAWIEGVYVCRYLYIGNNVSLVRSLVHECGPFEPCLRDAMRMFGIVIRSDDRIRRIGCMKVKCLFVYCVKKLCTIMWLWRVLFVIVLIASF